MSNSFYCSIACGFAAFNKLSKDLLREPKYVHDCSSLNSLDMKNLKFLKILMQEMKFSTYKQSLLGITHYQSLAISSIEELVSFHSQNLLLV